MNKISYGPNIYETVSFDKLKEFLPESCYEAIQNNHEINTETNLQEQYFNAVPVRELDEKERKELFLELGNNLIKNHYSTEELRNFLDTRPLEPLSRDLEENIEYKSERITKRKILNE